MKPILKWMPLMLCSSLALSGCGLFQDGYYYDRNVEYQKAEMAKPLELPASSNQVRYQDSMPVPEADSDFSASDAIDDAPRPQPLASGQGDDQPYAEMRQAGSEHWLLVDAAPASVWPRLQGFAVDHGVNPTAINAAGGRIETAQGSVSLRQGLRSGTSEVRCDIGSSAQCLSSIKAYLDNNHTADSGVSLAAQPLDQSERVKLRNRGGNWELDLALDGERAWSELYYQLQNGFDDNRLTVTDQNRSAGQFFIDYLPLDADDGGWFNWFGSDPQPNRYRLQLDSNAGNSVVTVTGSDGQPIEPAAARELLDAIASTLR
ncbi:outer membrane protein assembly factor BamC [Salinicola corii]|uniref:Outer membrane protein assembly factor BamC n=1 Tax=Salinicola corii TaxID=2606937 RepID=A0A640WH29_9GAMM|nr:outer membrane protein assembly factor BamC [Salinicola corii]KAA0019667.1 outer membrane protein assembly factor BamC [Salinicola corii]